MILDSVSLWLTVIGWALFGMAGFFAIPAMFYFPCRRLREFSEALPAPIIWPSVSIVVAARNEAASVREALSGWLKLDYPDIEIVFVDDRSTDDTGSIADELAQHDSRLTVIHNSELPSGWLGKCHALSLAARRARGEFLLFTDGDVLFEPQAIRSALRYVIGKKLDHFCLLPGVITSSYLERALVAMFGLLFLFGTVPWLRRWKVPHAYCGVGAFNLVRRTAYDAAGGHDLIRMDVLDDVKLGKLLYRHGCSSDVLLGGQDVRVRWQDSTWGVVRGLEKNAFASMRYSVRQLVMFSLFYLSIFVLPCAALCWAANPIAAGYLATGLLMHAAYARLARAFGAGVEVAPVMLVTSCLLLFAFWRSAFLTLRRGGVAWRDTVYPLSQLREQQYE